MDYGGKKFLLRWSMKQRTGYFCYQINKQRKGAYLVISIDDFFFCFATTYLSKAKQG